MLTITKRSQVVMLTILLSIAAVIGEQILAWLLFDYDLFIEGRFYGGLIAAILSPPLCAIIVYEVYRMGRRREELQQRLAHDLLTGLTSRRELNDQERRITETPGVLLLLDVDHFKRVNDSLGHSVGDEVLQNVAHVLRDHCRQTDLACRYGGEEFLVFFPKTDAKTGQKLADRMRKAVGENVHVQYDGVKTPITVSGGWMHKPAGQRMSDAINHVDTALYAAKHNGRNQLCAHKDPQEVSQSKGAQHVPC